MKKILLFVSVSAIANISFGMHPDRNYINNQQNNMRDIGQQGGSTNLNKKNSLKRVREQGIVKKFLQQKIHNDEIDNNMDNGLSHQKSIEKLGKRRIVSEILQQKIYNDETGNNKDSQQLEIIVEQESQSKNQQGVSNGKIVNNDDSLDLLGQQREVTKQRQFNRPQENETLDEGSGISETFNASSESDLNDDASISSEAEFGVRLIGDIQKKKKNTSLTKLKGLFNFKRKGLFNFKKKGLFNSKKKDRKGATKEETQSLLENQSEDGASNKIAQNNTKKRVLRKSKGWFDSKRKDQSGNQERVERGEFSGDLGGEVVRYIEDNLVERGEFSGDLGGDIYRKGSFLFADDGNRERLQGIANIQNQDENLQETADVQDKKNFIERIMSFAFLVGGLVVQNTEAGVGVYKAWNTMSKESDDGLAKRFFEVYTKDLAKQNRDLGNLLIKSSEVLSGEKGWSELVPNSLQLFWQGVNELFGNQRKVEEDNKSQENQTENVRNTQVKNVAVRIVAFFNLFLGTVIKDGNPFIACVVAAYKVFLEHDDTFMDRVKEAWGEGLSKQSKVLGNLLVGCSDVISGAKKWDEVLTDVSLIKKGIEDMLGQTSRENLQQPHQIKEGMENMLGRTRLQQEDDKSKKEESEVVNVESIEEEEVVGLLKAVNVNSIKGKEAANDNEIIDLLEEKGSEFSLLAHELFDLKQGRRDKEQLTNVRMRLINYFGEIGLSTQDIDIILGSKKKEKRVLESEFTY